MSSVWEQVSDKPVFGSLNKDVKTEVLIIGGGMAGVLCAYQLKQAGVPYILVEEKNIGCGITKNTTAKITSQHGLIYDKLTKKYGIWRAKQYLLANETALKKYCDLCQNIDCDFELKDSYVYSIEDRQKIENEIQALKSLGFHTEFKNDLPLPFRIAGAILFPNQGQFNPLKFLYSISKGLNIYENTKVLELIGTTAITDYGKISAKKIIVATHFPFINKHGCYFIKMYQHRSYVIALENATDIRGMYVDQANTGMSFRNYDNLLLIGGGGHRTGKTGGNWQELREFARKFYPNSKEKYHWATQDCMTLDGIPYIGPYSKTTKDLYVATGFNKWGMTTSMVAAMILCDMVQGKRNCFENVFSPSRSILHPQLAVNAFESTKGLLCPTTKRCPHLGCALKWNPVEHTWDCSCHGSRFSESGKVIDNPATGNIK